MNRDARPRDFFAGIHDRQTSENTELQTPTLREARRMGHPQIITRLGVVPSPASMNAAKASQSTRFLMLRFRMRP
jgi:hypothetical protein